MYFVQFTGVVVVLRMQTITLGFRADRAFMYVIKDPNAAGGLFWGTVQQF